MTDKAERDKRHDAKRSQEEHRPWYKRAIWCCPKHGLRIQQLRRQPLCERHYKQGRIVSADTVNHRKAVSSGRTWAEKWALFIDPDNHESVCSNCHNSAIQSEERRGYSSEVGDDGWPIDPQHPANRPR